MTQADIALGIEAGRDASAAIPRRAQASLRGTILEYVSLWKPRIVLVLAVVALGSAVAVAGNQVSWDRVILGVAALILAAAGASGLNNYHDRKIDGLMDRTRLRPLVRGTVDGRAVIVGAVCLLASGVAVAFGIDYLTGAFVACGAAVYSFVYTYLLKRRTPLSIVVGGLAGSFAALTGSASAGDSLSPAALLIALTLFVWTPVHFWNFAIVHRESYRKAGVPMLPVVAGVPATVKWTLVHATLLFLTSIALHVSGKFGAVFLVSAVVLGTMVVVGNLHMLRGPTNEKAWSNYKMSGVYLLGLFVAAVVDRMLF